ncbi:RecT family recombinase [Caproiciproducens sp.]|uniref:RecT family recombinase n=1 Tax=Caproiciproducens sp. TaxID=1954376 RepID=UPI0028A0E1E9|nr:RecT family recombinase [Caproiciproducens sp.]
MSNKLSVVQAATTAVSTDVRGFLAHGSLQLPANYSVENALKSAALTLPSVKNFQNCTQESIKASLLSMCVQGLNPDKKQCYFIAYGETLALQRSYLGDIAVAKQVDPSIEEIYAAAVFEGDKFEYEIKHGKIVEIHHMQKLENKNKPITAAYVTVVYRGGAEISTVMTIDQIKQAWAQSTSKPFDEKGNLKQDSVHAKFPEEMAKKTVVHKACKPIIGSSSDASLFGQYARQCADDADAAEVDAEVEENANREMIDADYREVPDNMDPETGEVIEPVTDKKEAEPF